MKKEKVLSGKISDRVFYGLYRISVHHKGEEIESWYCGYLIGKKKFLKRIGARLNNIVEITYPGNWFYKRKVSNRIGFDTAHYGMNHSLDEANKFLEKWIEIAKNEIERRKNG